jgi:hypothetical protein
VVAIALTNPIQIKCAVVAGFPPTNDRTVFVTSTTYDGNLGGLAGADAKCQARASAASLPGTYKAWLSDSTVSAGDRMTHSTGAYKLKNGTVVATNWTDLTDGSLASPISHDEFGNPAGEYPFQNITTTAFTATFANGNANLSNGFHCNDWTSNADGAGWLGQTIFSDGRWSHVNSVTSCTGVNVAPAGSFDGKSRLYCVQQ